MDPIAVAQNNKVTYNATKSAEVEVIIYLSSYIKALAQEDYLEMPCLSTAIGALESYYVLELLKKNDTLEGKDAELDPGVVLENLIDNYLEVVKGWSSRPKEPEAEIGSSLKVDNVKDGTEVKIDNVSIGPKRIVNNESRIAEAKKSKIIRNWEKKMNQELDNKIIEATNQKN
ncbi:34888_t:CDS:2 [Gigaspora margarita]|uniref:34888_t:CDS:1 n=1 Tax=Gigaspora margarita TaxID=4874 RepID=A0ABN7VM14_GIGMA|nr:34888_t:CDS:2 [Gigaspora margarita]